MPTIRLSIFCIHLRISEGRPDGEIEGISVGTSLGEEDGRREGRCWLVAMEKDNRKENTMRKKYYYMSININECAIGSHKVSVLLRCWPNSHR